MNHDNHHFAKPNLLAFAIALVLNMIAPVPSASAEEDSDLTDLTLPKSSIELGTGGVSDSAWKFGQYNGLNQSGAFGIGNFDIFGGGAYNSDDATRWRITGRDIGLETRSFQGSYKEQGRYKLNFGYDELVMYRNNTYRTPYNGVGGSQLTLPSDWKYPTTANNMRTLPNSDLPDFHNVDMGTKRRKIDGGFSYFLDDNWELQGSFRHENKNGLQALGAPIVAPRSVILPNPIDQSTEQINGSLKYTGEKAFAQFAYYGSLFHNDVNGVSFQTPFSAAAPKFGQMSSAPDNQFHQFNLTGGYNFSRDTKLVTNGSYGRNWQNQAFLPYNTSASGGGVLPTTGLNGDVETKSINLKLTHRVNQNLNLASAYKFDERQNNTPINLYKYADADGLGAASNFRSNTPYSKRINQGNLDVDYSFAKGHWLKTGYELQGIDRWCNGTWLSCVDTGTTIEHTGKLDYRGNLFDKLSAKLGYAYSYRKADQYNQDNAYFASLQNTSAITAFYNQLAATGLTAWGPFLPYGSGAAVLYPSLFPNNNTPTSIGGLAMNGIDIAGLGRFNTSDRERQKVHTYFDYQATDKLTLGLGGDFRYDQYPNSTFGQRSSTNWGINLDAGYAFDEDTNLQVYYSYQDNRTKTAGMSYAASTNTGSTVANTVLGGCYNTVRLINNNAKIDPCRDWFTNMNDNIDTVGFGLKHKGFFNGKLDVNTDFLYSYATTLIGVDGGQYVRSPTGTANNGPYYYIPASNMPVVKTQVFQFKLDAKYIINKPSALHFSYQFQRLLSSDYIYTGMQPAGTPTGVMPTFEQTPDYSLHVVGLSYIYHF